MEAATLRVIAPKSSRLLWGQFSAHKSAGHKQALSARIYDIRPWLPKQSISHRVLLSTSPTSNLRRYTKCTSALETVQTEKASFTQLEGDTRPCHATIKQEVSVTGVGLHSGCDFCLTLRPARPGQGRYFLVPDSKAGSGYRIRLNASVENAVESRLCTVLQSPHSEVVTGADKAGPAAEAVSDDKEMPVAEVRTAEHLLSALEGMGIMSVEMELEPVGGNELEHTWLELPLLDGSSLPWVNLLLQAGLVPLEESGAEPTRQGGLRDRSLALTFDKHTQEGTRQHQQQRWQVAVERLTTAHMEESTVGQISEEQRQLAIELVKEAALVFVVEGDSLVAAFPHPYPLITCGISFPQLPAVQTQWVQWSPIDTLNMQPAHSFLPATVYSLPSSYHSSVAPARTFAIAEQVQQLRQAGLIKGGSLENALVCSVDSGWLNPPLRFEDEPCRHKLLDLLGDLALLAEPGTNGVPCAHIVAYKASHALHCRFAKLLKPRLISSSKS